MSIISKHNNNNHTMVRTEREIYTVQTDRDFLQKVKEKTSQQTSEPNI